MCQVSRVDSRMRTSVAQCILLNRVQSGPRRRALLWVLYTSVQQLLLSVCRLPFKYMESLCRTKCFALLQLRIALSKCAANLSVKCHIVFIVAVSIRRYCVCTWNGSAGTTSSAQKWTSTSSSPWRRWICRSMCWVTSRTPDWMGQTSTIWQRSSSTTAPGNTFFNSSH